MTTLPAEILRAATPATETRSGSPSPGRSSKRRRNASPSMRDAWHKSRSGLAVVLTLTAFINILKLTIPLYIFQLLDRVVASRSIDTLILLTVITVFAVLVAGLSEVIRKTMLSHWGGWIETHFGRQLFLSSFGRLRRRGPGKAIEDLGTVSGFVSGSGMTTWLDALWAPAFLVVVYLIHPYLGCIVLAGMLCMLGLGVLNEYLTRPMREQMRKANRRSESWLAVAEQHPETMAGLNIGDRLADKWHTSAARRGVERRMSRLTSDTVGEAMRVAEAGQRIACYGVGVWLAIGGWLSVGGIIAGAVLGRIGTSAVRRAMGNWRQLVIARRAYMRVRRRLDSISRARTAIRDPDAQLALQLDQVSFTHTPWSQPLFRQLDLTVEPGQMLCIIGPSGSGKSTLAMLIAGVLQPTMGTVRLGSLEMTRFTPSERRKHVGYMPQSIGLLDGSIADNIASLATPDERKLVAAAKLAGVHDVVAALPKGYETRISSQKSLLSGGELRRLALARAVYGRPRLVVLDEPETNLDAELVAHLQASLEDLKAQGLAIVVTSQLKQLADVSDKIVLLSRRGPAQVFATRDAFQAACPRLHHDHDHKLPASQVVN